MRLVILLFLGFESEDPVFNYLATDWHILGFDDVDVHVDVLEAFEGNDFSLLDCGFQFATLDEEPVEDADEGVGTSVNWELFNDVLVVVRAGGRRLLSRTTLGSVFHLIINGMTSPQSRQINNCILIDLCLQAR